MRFIKCEKFDIYSRNFVKGIKYFLKVKINFYSESMYPEKDKQLEQDKEYFFLSFSFKVNVNFLNIYIVGNLTCRKSLLGLFNM